MRGLAERLAAKVRWDGLRDISGSAAGVGSALGDLLNAETPAQASAAYWGLENRVVVQGSLFEAAEPVTSVLVAALIEPRRLHIRLAVLELLFQIVKGEPDRSEVALGGGDLGSRCRQRAREGLWQLFREYFDGATEAAADVLRVIDPGHFETLASQVSDPG